MKYVVNYIKANHNKIAYTHTNKEKILKTVIDTLCIEEQREEYQIYC